MVHLVSADNTDRPPEAEVAGSSPAGCAIENQPLSGDFLNAESAGNCAIAQLPADRGAKTVGQALQYLHARGAHFVLSDTQKRPIGKRWQKKPASFRDVSAHVGNGGLVGVVPSSLQLACIDVDEGGKTGVDAVAELLGPPITVTRTRRKDGFHVWYRVPGDAVVGNRKWQCADASGDVRGSRGFAILWDAQQLAHELLYCFDAAEPVKLDGLPRHSTTLRGPEAVRRATEGTRNDTLNKEVFLAAKDGTSDLEAFRGAARENGLPDREIDSTLASAAAAGKRQRAKNADTHHLGFARKFIATHGQNRRFCRTRGKWMAWTTSDGWNEARQPRGDMAQVIETAVPAKNRPIWVRATHISGSLVLAAEQLRHDDWDQNPGLLGLPGGRVVDLAIGKERDQDRHDFITMRTGCELGQGVSQRWLDFVSEACGGDQEMIHSLQIAIGASAFGHNREHRVQILCGDGGTGKSVFAGTVQAALDTYATSLPASVLASRTEQHPTGVASLLRKRLAVVPEVSGGMFRAETLLALSGGDLIPARFMRQDFFDFRPGATLWIMTNQPPSVHLVDNAIRRRIRIWPFETKPADPDPTLPERLRSAAELPGALRWIVDGAVLYAKNGIKDCRAVQAATAAYFEATNSVSGWIEARCTVTPEAKTPARTLFRDYQAWCSAEGIRPITGTAWGITVGRLAEKRRVRTGNVYALAIRSDRA